MIIFCCLIISFGIVPFIVENWVHVRKIIAEKCKRKKNNVFAKKPKAEQLVYSSIKIKRISIKSNIKPLPLIKESCKGKSIQGFTKPKKSIRVNPIFSNQLNRLPSKTTSERRIKSPLRPSIFYLNSKLQKVQAYNPVSLRDNLSPGRAPTKSACFIPKPMSQSLATSQNSFL